jgi:ribonuclease BN (tRNA processing enzyme)
VQRLVLTHMPPWNDPVAARAEAAEVWTGPLDVAEPGATFVLGSP